MPFFHVLVLVIGHLLWVDASSLVTIVPPSSATYGHICYHKPNGKVYGFNKGESSVYEFLPDGGFTQHTLTGSIQNICSDSVADIIFVSTTNSFVAYRPGATWTNLWQTTTLDSMFNADACGVGAYAVLNSRMIVVAQSGDYCMSCVGTPPTWTCDILKSVFLIIFNPLTFQYSPRGGFCGPQEGGPFTGMASVMFSGVNYFYIGYKNKIGRTYVSSWALQDAFFILVTQAAGSFVQLDGLAMVDGPELLVGDQGWIWKIDNIDGAAGTQNIVAVAGDGQNIQSGDPDTYHPLSHTIADLKDIVEFDGNSILLRSYTTISSILKGRIRKLSLFTNSKTLTSPLTVSRSITLVLTSSKTLAGPLTASNTITLPRTKTKTPTPTITPGPTITPPPTPTGTRSRTKPLTRSVTLRPTVTQSVTLTKHTFSSSHIRSITVSGAISVTFSISKLPTVSGSFSFTPGPTRTQTPSKTKTITYTPSPLPTRTPSVMLTETISLSRTATVSRNTPSLSSTNSQTPTPTPPPTLTPSLSISHTVSLTVSESFTHTLTRSNSWSGPSSSTLSLLPTETISTSLSQSMTTSFVETKTVTLLSSDTATITLTQWISPSSTETSSLSPSTSLTLMESPSLTFSLELFLTVTDSIRKTTTSSLSATVVQTLTHSETPTPRLLTKTLLPAGERPCPIIEVWCTPTWPNIEAASLVEGGVILTLKLLPPSDNSAALYQWDLDQVNHGGVFLYSVHEEGAQQGASSPGGFDQKIAPLLRYNNTWQKTPILPVTTHQLKDPTSIFVTLPAIKSFYLTVPEKILAQITAQSIVGGCKEDAVVSSNFLTLNPAVEPKLLQAGETFAAAVGTAAASSAVLTGAGMIAADAQILAILGQMPCARPSQRRLTSPLRLFLSPFWDFGWVAVIIGNIVAVFLLVVIQSVIGKLWIMSSEKKEHSSEEPLLIFQELHEEEGPSSKKEEQGHHEESTSQLHYYAKIRFPALTLALNSFLFQGISFASFQLLFQGEIPDALLTVVALPLRFGIAFFGILYCLLSIFICRKIIHKFIRSTEFLQYSIFQNKSRAVRWLFPSGYWAPKAMRMAFGHFLTPVNKDAIFWAPSVSLYPILIMLISFIAALNPLPPSFSEDLCYIPYFLIALLFIFAAVGVIRKRPFRLLLKTFFTFIAFLLLAGISAGIGLTFFVIEKEWYMPTIHKAIQILLICQCAVIGLHLMYELIMMGLENCQWYAEEERGGENTPEEEDGPIIEMKNYFHEEGEQEMQAVAESKRHYPNSRVSIASSAATGDIGQQLFTEQWLMPESSSLLLQRQQREKARELAKEKRDASFRELEKTILGKHSDRLSEEHDELNQLLEFIGNEGESETKGPPRKTNSSFVDDPDL